MANINESIVNTPKSQKLLRKYDSKLKLAESAVAKRGLDMTFERKLATAQTLENTSRHIRAMESVNGFGPGQASQPANVGQYKRYAIDMVGTIVPSLIAPDVVSVQAVDNRVGMINILQFQYGSDKGGAKEGDVFASPLAYQGMDKSYTSSHIDGEDIAVDATGATTLAWGPIRQGSVTFYDASGAPVGRDGDGTVVVNYGTGEVTGLTGLNAVSAAYTYDNETVPVKTPTMKMDIKSLPITTQSRKLSAVWAFDAAYELEKEYGQSMQDILATQAAAEIAQEVDNEITLDLFRIANAGPQVMWDRTQPVGVSAADHYDSFYNKIVEGSNEIFKATRRAHANFMICGLNVDAVLKCMRNFEAVKDESAIGPHFIGTLGGQIKVYVNPNYDADTFVLGYKGPNMLDAGYVYCPYMPVMTTDMITLADDFASRQGFATMYGKKAINPRLYVKGRIA